MDVDSVTHLVVSEVLARDTHVLWVKLNGVDLRVAGTVGEPQGAITQSCTNLDNTAGIDCCGKDPEEGAFVIGVCSAAMLGAVGVGGSQDSSEWVNSGQT
jgi:hypothetical protein